MADPVDARKAIEEALLAIKTMVREEAITPDIYFKGLVSLAYEYVLLNDASAATDLLNLVPVEYFLGVQDKQMEDDPVYAEVSVKLAKYLIDAGLVDQEPEEPEEEQFTFTQKPANA